MKLRVTLLIALTLLTFACGKKKDDIVKAAEALPLQVSTARAEARDVQAGFAETGSFVADESSDIAPPVAGLVLKTPVDAGSWVRQGQVICELDHRDAELKLQQAKAQLEQALAGVKQAQSRIGWNSGSFDANKVPEVAAARANYESAVAQAKLAAADAQRYANLVASGDVSRSAFDKAHTQQETAEAQANAAKQQYEAAANGARQSYEGVSSSQASLDAVKAQLAQAQKAVADTTIRAPFDGFITARPVAAGEYVALSSKIATIVRMRTLKLDLQTPEQRAARAKIGMDVIARVSAYPDRDFHGKVSAVNPSVDPSSRVFILEARFDNADSALRPGMFSTARVLLPGGETAVFVPGSAIVRDKTTDSNQVFVIQDHKSHLRVVQVGDTDGAQVRIVNGINAGEVVATGNQSALYDGAEVQAKVQ